MFVVYECFVGVPRHTHTREQNVWRLQVSSTDTFLVPESLTEPGAHHRPHWLVAALALVLKLRTQVLMHVWRTLYKPSRLPCLLLDFL